MDLTFILVIFSYFLFALSLLYIPLKKNKIMKLVGEPLLPFPKKGYGMIVSVEIVAFILITILFFIRYSFFVSLVLCACGVLGAWIVTGEASLGSKYGLYENGIVAVGKFIPYDDIVTYPILNLPKSEQANYPDNVLVVACRKYGNVEIVFESADVCAQVISKLEEIGEIK